MGSAIQLYCACRNCEKTRPRKMSRCEYSRLDIGMTATGLQVWCRRCELEVGHFTPEALRSQLGDARCECCPGGMHVN